MDVAWANRFVTNVTWVREGKVPKLAALYLHGGDALLHSNLRLTQRERAYGRGR